MRDYFLSCSDDELLEHCRLDFYKATGNGGQKRNKTSSAVRIIHIPTNLQASDCSGRDQHQNRKKAVGKLRMLLAMEIRCAFADDLERYDCSVNNPKFPLTAAKLLDLLEESKFLISDAAVKINKSTSGLIKIIAASPELWQQVNRRRTILGLDLLRMPH